MGRIGRAIKRFVMNPYTNLAKGVVLVLIGLSEAWHTLVDDVAHPRLRLGHGLIIIGLFSILDTLPHFIDGDEASRRYLALRGRGDRPQPGPPREAGPMEPDPEAF